MYIQPKVSSMKIFLRSTCIQEFPTEVHSVTWLLTGKGHFFTLIARKIIFCVLLFCLNAVVLLLLL